jgi:hypothetical protein
VKQVSISSFLGISCDLSKAFDCVDHGILLEKLKAYGVRGQASTWMESYLTDRSQLVELKTADGVKVSSSWAKLSVGVPQGSVLGPLLFLIFVNDLPTHMKETRVIMFADDTSALVEAKSVDSLKDKGAKVLNDLNDWFTSNKLLLNVNKTSLLLFKNSYQRKVPGFHLNTDEEVINTSCSVKFLGLMLDENLRWDAQEDYLGKKLRAACFALFKVRDIMSKDNLKLIYHAYFYSVATYGISAWGNSKSTLSRVFTLQKYALRTVMRFRRKKSCKTIFEKEKLLTIPGAFVLESLCYVYKQKYSFPVNSDFHNYNTRHAKDFAVPQHRLKSTEKDVNYIGIKLFNHLPHVLTNSSSYDSFRYSIKNLLIKAVLYDIDDFFKINLVLP